jgi:8-oxo-dGTP pyrophosphatase MutT (NUDIX family)
MSYLDRLRACRRHDSSAYLPFLVARERFGWIRPAFARRLAAYPDVFRVGPHAVSVNDDLADAEARTAAVARVLRALFEAGHVRGWREEAYAVVRAWGEAPVMRVERAAAAYLGIRAFGVHVNGFVRGPNGLEVWIGRRADDLAVDPGKLDHLVAGGLPAGSTPRETLVKEAAEEAGIEAELAAAAVPVGELTYRLEVEHGLRNDTLFLYDLELPLAFRPVNRDGEAAAFARWPVERVMTAVRETDDFKFNVGPVLIDFFVRHGLLGPDDPEFTAVLRELRG